MPTLRHLLLPLLLAPLLTLAEPLQWHVPSNYGWQWNDDEESPLITGCMITYIGSNLSPPGDANNLVTFTVPAGANGGVVNAAAPEG